ncbi:MAG: glycerol kinase [Lachnospiraceae bacterium]|nr:glycerol kinase [Lachnospiraceae bacterium]
MKLFAGIDQGTTLTTAVITDENGHMLAKASRPHSNYYPYPGWVEQDPQEIYDNCLGAISDAAAKIPGAKTSDIIGFGMDHQGETCLVWEKDTADPIFRMIVWQDRRTSEDADRLDREYGDRILAVTGVKADAYYSATKIAWILDHVEGARARYERGELMVGTFNTWFFYRISGKTIYATDPGSASCMMLTDLARCDWDDFMLGLFGLRRELMPQMADSIGSFGYTDPACFLGAKALIGAALEDSSAGIIGSGCVGEGILKTSYGTGSFMSLQTGETLVPSKPDLFSNCLWTYHGRPWFRLRGSCYSAGSSVEWLVKGLGLIENAAESETLARSVPDTGDVYYVPALSGLATPFWDQYARGTLIGMTAGTTRAHIVRAVLEALAYQVTNSYLAMSDAYGRRSQLMRADGGPVENAFLMQFQSDMLGIPVEIPEEKEAAAYGSACASAIAAGALGGPDDVKKLVRLKKTYEPSMSDAEREEKLMRWLEAVRRSSGWALR